jgi:tetratricopeptide (TPR) repeat protein
LALSARLEAEEKIWVELDREAQRLRDQGQYRAAEQQFLKAYQAAEAHLGPKDINTVVIRHNLALIAAALGNYSEAEQLLEQTLPDLEASLGPDHPLVAENLNSLGSVYFRVRRFRDAERVFERGLAIRNKAQPLDPAKLAIILNSLAATYLELGEYDKAGPMLQRVIGLLDAPSSDRPNLAAACHNLGILRYRQREYADAEILLARALAIREDALGPDHPLVALSLASYAAVLRKTHRSAQASTLEKRAAAIQKRHATENVTGLTVDLQSLR